MSQRGPRQGASGVSQAEMEYSVLERESRDAPHEELPDKTHCCWLNVKFRLTSGQFFRTSISTVWHGHPYPKAEIGRLFETEI